MANIKISGATDIVSLNSSDMFPVARSGSPTAYHATAAEVASFAGVTATTATQNNNGRNILHNGLLWVQQRLLGPWTTTGSMTADRWEMGFVNDTMTVQIGTMTDALRSQIGDEAALYYLSNTFAGNAAAGSYNQLVQKIERVRRLSGKSVTVSFWANAGVAGLHLGVNLAQFFGTGGSPSATVNVAGQSVTLTTTMSRYTLTFAIPTASGMTLGTNGDDCIWLNFWYSAGATFATPAGGIGVQSGVVSLWGIQLEIGTTATPLEKLDYGLDLVNCQRFYQGLQYGLYTYAPVAGGDVGGFAYYPTEMRMPPFINISGPVGADSNVAVVNAPDQISITSFRFTFQATAAGMVIATRNAYLSSDL